MSDKEFIFESFIVKSNKNEEIAIYAEEKGYYDIAVNRYYYSLYQRIYNYVLKNTFPTNKTHSHSYPIATFANLVSKGDKKLASRVKIKIQALQKYREMYEYEEEFLTKKDFDKFYKNLKSFQSEYKTELEL